MTAHLYLLFIISNFVFKQKEIFANHVLLWVRSVTPSANKNCRKLRQETTQHDGKTAPGYAAIYYLQLKKV